MAYAVTTQAISVVVAPTLPLISRNETFTMVVSSNSRMAQLIAVMTKIHLSAPVGYTMGVFKAEVSKII